MTGRPGRPRAGEDRDTAGAVLSAAAELFSSVGYTATSTYAVAERAGVRQASIYHHFRGKPAILLSLLLTTLRPALALADHLVAAPGSAAARLWALCDADARLLADGPVNLGALMHLPEVRGEAFTEFRDLRARLRSRYDALVAEVLGSADASPCPERNDLPAVSRHTRPLDVAAAGTLVFGLVESVIAERREGGVLRAAAVAPTVADAALRVLGLGPAAVARARSEAVRLPAVAPPAPAAPEPGPQPAPRSAGTDEMTTAQVADVG
ncbi:MAG TPA: helix-turn-helix domain-containing protein [Cellulomonas sp.]